MQIRLARIEGRVRWSACTKLHRALDRDLLRRLAAGGCDTLEIGLETIDPEGQQRISKRQSKELFLRVLDAAAAAGVGMVVNYITGFPGEDAAAGVRDLGWVEEQLALRRPGLRAVLEHNGFQLERLSPMARRPEAFGVRVTGEWPWATVLGWEAAPVRRAARLAVVGAGVRGGEAGAVQALVRGAGEDAGGGSEEGGGEGARDEGEESRGRAAVRRAPQRDGRPAMLQGALAMAMLLTVDALTSTGALQALQTPPVIAVQRTCCMVAVAPST